jgi:hypothetical protein
MSRLSDIRTLYSALTELGQRTGGPRAMATCSGRDAWPQRGVYFFFEPGEVRSTSGDGLGVAVNQAFVRRLCRISSPSTRDRLSWL